MYLKKKKLVVFEMKTKPSLSTIMNFAMLDFVTNLIAVINIRLFDSAASPTFTFNKIIYLYLSVITFSPTSVPARPFNDFLILFPAIK